MARTADSSVLRWAAGVSTAWPSAAAEVRRRGFRVAAVYFHGRLGHLIRGELAVECFFALAPQLSPQGGIVQEPPQAARQVGAS